MSSTPLFSRRRLLFGGETIASPEPAPRNIPLAEAGAAFDPVASRAIATIEVARCLNAQGVVCASCADACPHRAIVIPLRQRAAIHVIADRCDGCADCVSVCPSHAVALQQSSLEPA